MTGASQPKERLDGRNQPAHAGCAQPSEAAETLERPVESTPDGQTDDGLDVALRW